MLAGVLPFEPARAAAPCRLRATGHSGDQALIARPTRPIGRKVRRRLPFAALDW